VIITISKAVLVND